MTPGLRAMVVDRDEIGLERAYYENDFPHFFDVDWPEEDDEVVACCAAALDLELLTAEWRGDDLFVTFDGRSVKVRLEDDVGDRHRTICAVNDLLSPKYEVRFIVVSHGNDTLGFAALSVADWRELGRGQSFGRRRKFHRSPQAAEPGDQPISDRKNAFSPVAGGRLYAKMG